MVYYLGMENTSHNKLVDRSEARIEREAAGLYGVHFNGLKVGRILKSDTEWQLWLSAYYMDKLVLRGTFESKSSAAEFVAEEAADNFYPFEAR
jgi:hypothetical protein